MKNNSNITLTKWSLFKKTLLPFVKLLLWVGLVVVVISQVLYLFGVSVLPWQEGLLMGFVYGFAIFAFGIVICAVRPTHQIIYIIDQERALNFSFSDEMSSRGITEPKYQDKLWFIFTEQHEILVIRRDYIRKIKKVKDHSREGALRAMIVERFDGKEIKIVASEEGIEEFERWFCEQEA